MYTYNFSDGIIPYGYFSGRTDIVRADICDGITTINSKGFSGCANLTSVNIPNSVTSIGQGVFSYCTSLPSITLPSGLTWIGSEVFENCRSLQSIDIPNSVTSIGSQAFYDCDSLTSITLPSGVTEIGSYAFYNCSSLTSITCYATTAPTIYSNAFEGLPSGGTLYYPCGSDYSTWLSNNEYYLGYYGWSGVCFNPTPSGSTSGDTSGSTSGSTSGDTSGSTSGDTSGSTSEYANLGLSVKWARTNLGTSSDASYGLYCQWGASSVDDTALNPEGKTTLSDEDDIANVMLGSKWRIPTEAEWQELFDNCTVTSYSEGSIFGLKFSRNGDYIFIPFCGSKNSAEGEITALGLNGMYWTSEGANNYAFGAFITAPGTSDDLQINTVSSSMYRGIRAVFGDRNESSGGTSGDT